MTRKNRVELYRRLPEIYRIKDEDLPKLYLQDGQAVPANQLLKYLEPVEEMFSAIHENIESLYHDLFIETCDDWVIPYIGDLLGTTHLSGDEWTLRADVADTIALRRRKGTLGAIELLAFILTKWGVHSVELLENIVWNQHLNHQRPDEGGAPPYSLPTVRPETPIRGGTVTLRDPSLLAQLGTPFDPFAHVADVKPHEIGQVRYNLPNLAIYLWRLKDYRLNVTKPRARKVTPEATLFPNPVYPQAARVVRLNVDHIPVNALSRPYVKTAPKDNRPEGRPVTLFNTNRLQLFSNTRKGTDALNLSAIAPRISGADQVPGPIPRMRLSELDIAEAYDKSLASDAPLPFEAFANASFTAPQEYVSVETYDVIPPAVNPDPVDISDVGLQFHIPNSVFPDQKWLHTTKNSRAWTIRGENLCSWERGLNPPLGEREIAIDPVNGRIAFGFGELGKPATHATANTQANAVVKDLLLTYTYGAVGPVGAHPVSYPALPEEFEPPGFFKQVSDLTGLDSLQPALDAAITAGKYPIVIELANSFVHKLNIATMANAVSENGRPSLLLDGSLVIRSADGQRPIIELRRPLAFRPKNVAGIGSVQQKKFDAVMDRMTVRLEGLYIARGLNFGANLPLISRAALSKLEILSCTLDPGGFKYFNGGRAPLLPGINLREPYGFAANADELAFKQTPEIIIQRSICGAVFTDEGYSLCIADSIVESIPVSVPQSAGPAKVYPFAITGATNPAAGYACRTVVENVTVLGRVRTYSVEGAGGIFTGVVEAFDQQTGCLKYCWFADDSQSPPAPDSVKNRLPQHFACVFGGDARLIFTSQYFGAPGYCQLSLECDQRILEQGVGDDQMGAFNFLREAHKWRNLKIRFREFMPVGIRPLLIPVT